MNQELGNKAKRFVVLETFLQFTRQQAFSGILLLITTACAIFWANSAWSDSYNSLWKTYFTIGFGEFILSKPLLLWINDGLMALFFFVVGLEIKREILYGELSSPRKAALPIFAAIGGMVVPAFIYILFNYNEPSASGWGVPMATDIAFSLGILALLGSRVPISLKIFLTALAIADDLGAVVVIALFYSSDISVLNISIGLLFLITMIAVNRAGVRSAWIYALLGIGGVWFAFLLSGVHPTIAGILGALAIPASTRIPPTEFNLKVSSLMRRLERSTQNDTKSQLLTGDEQEAISSVKEACRDVEAPLQSLEHSLHPWISFLVMPVFALSNSGLIISSDAQTLLGHSVSLGILFGLLVGKVVGISLFSFLSCKLGLASLPEKVSWINIIGIGFITGIGFTMSLFISGLAFDSDLFQMASKYGIFTGSLLSGVIGFIILRMTLKKGSSEE